VETFAPARPFIDNPAFARERERALADLDPAGIDAPLRSLIADFTRLPFCFTLQCCFGHFLDSAAKDPESLEPLPARDTGPVRYRIAYLALCLENSREGRRFSLQLEKIAAAAPDFIQFGSPAWFWKRQPNSFALQVEPQRFRDRDAVMLEHAEARVVQRIRDRFFADLAELVRPGASG
jgi:hypothetical protein